MEKWFSRDAIEKANSRRDWLKTSGAALFGSSTLASNAKSTSDAPANVAPSPQNPVRMMYNENPLPPSPKVLKAMQEALEEVNTYSYFKVMAELKRRLAEREGVEPEQIIVGAGSTEVLRVTALQLLRKLPTNERRVVALSPGYEGMNGYAHQMGARIVRVPVKEDLSPDLPQLAAEVENGAALLNLCNPNNPTGVIVDEEKLAPFCQEMAKKSFVFVDEAYHEFVTNPKYGSMLPLVKAGHRVMVTRTFSKLFGLSGIRIGYGIASPDMVAGMEAAQTGTVNIVGLRAALAALQDEAFQKASLANNVEAKAILVDELTKLGRKYAPDEGNFIFFHTGLPIQQFQKKMLANGFRVGRPFPPYFDWCRLSLSTPQNMRLFCSALKKVLPS